MARSRPAAFNLETALAPFRRLEEQTDALVVLGDEAAMRVLVSWKKLDNDWTPPQSKMPSALAGSMAKLWKWVVAGWDLGAMEREVSRLAGVPRHVAHEKLEMLVGNRLIYPDGSTSKGAQSALAIFTAKKLGIKQQPPPQKPATTTPTPDDKSN